MHAPKHITFFSKQLTPAEAHYSATELETFAITCTMKHFTVISMIHLQTFIATIVNDNKRLMQ